MPINKIMLYFFSNVPDSGNKFSTNAVISENASINLA